MAGDNKTTTKRTIAASKVSKGGGGNQGKRKYRDGDDTKCSVDVGAANRAKASGEMQKPAVASATFNKGGTGNKAASAKSLTDTPKDARARACARWMEEIAATSLRNIRKDFVENVKRYVPEGETADAGKEHPNMCRYEDVVCLDATRVKLNPQTTPDGEDFIHANYVEIHSDLKYICAQGPMDEYVQHFWIMVMQVESKVVLQLCQLYENGEQKCSEYYPTAADGPGWKTYGCVQVRVIDRNSNVPGMKKVTKSKMQVRMEGKEKVHDVLHIYFFGWPDHGVPESVGTLKEIRSLIHRSYDKKPVVAHCSAGIGRTGSFAMVEMVCHRLLVKNDMEIKMPQIAIDLRHQRMGSVQTDIQYIFVYRCVLEILVGENALPKSPEVTKFIESYESLIERKKKDLKKKQK